MHLSVMDVIVLGGGGGLGKLVCEQLASKGHRAQAVGRRNLDVLESAAAPVIINCAGASVALGLGHGWRGYRAVDVPLGLRAIDAARRMRSRLVYVGVHHPPQLRDCAYVDAHERVAEAMRDVDGCVVRATGFFSAFASFIPIVKRTGVLPDIGSGAPRTNPICEHDLAEIIVDIALGSDGPRDVSAGGPDVMSRREIMELIASHAGRRVRIAGVPTWLIHAASVPLRAVHPRIGQFVRFAVGLARHDTIAPSLGTTRLADYLAGTAPLDTSRSTKASMPSTRPTSVYCQIDQ